MWSASHTPLVSFLLSRSLSLRPPHPHWLILLPQDLCTYSFWSALLSDSQVACSLVSFMIFLKYHLLLEALPTRCISQPIPLTPSLLRFLHSS